MAWMLSRRHAIVAIWTIVAAGIGLPASAETAIVPPPGASRPIPNSVTLQGGSHADIMRRLRIIRQIPVASARSNPISLGRARINFRPVFDNPRALFNVAQRLRTIPQHVDLLADQSELVEVEQGLLLHNIISYRIKPGVCTDAARQRQVSAAGVDCFNKQSDQARAAAFATKSDAHYVKDPAKRAQAIANSQRAAKQMRLDIDKHIAEFRSMLADPAKRAQVEAKIGSAEVVRLSQLDNSKLESELINSAERKSEEVLFIPNADAPLPDKISGMHIVPDPATAAQRRKMMFKALAPVIKDPPASPADVNKEFQLVDQDTGNEDVFLTGFTLSKGYEWHAREEITIYWCVIDCSSTYYVEASAGYGYAVGLRFPIQLRGKTHFNRAGGQESADVTPELVPINGTPDQFAATGLPSNLIFDGKELVAQFNAHGSFGYKLPALLGAAVGLPPSGNVGASIDFDLTEYLPAPFTGGHFQPPAPHDPSPSQFVQTFDQIDLLGDLANFGVAGAVVNPAVKFELRSDDLHMTLDDFVANRETTINNSTGTIPLQVSRDDHSAHFAIGDPVYNLGLTITPGVDPKLFIDIDVWSDSWDWPVWFPQASVELPPGGIDFSCHDGTNCARSYGVSEKGREETTQTNVAAASAVGTANVKFTSDLEQWKTDFTNTYSQQCADDACKLGIGFIRYGYALGAQQQHDANPTQVTIQTLKDGYLKGADKDATTLVQEAQARQTAKVAKAIADLQFAIWAKQCSDSRCVHDLHGLLFFEMWAMEAEQQQHPDESTFEVLKKIGPEFAKAAKQIIDDSKERAKAKLIFKLPPAVLSPTPLRPMRLLPSGRMQELIDNPPKRSSAPPAPGRHAPIYLAPAIVPATSTLCLFKNGPRSGQIQDYAPMSPLPIGTACQDGVGSSGVVVGKDQLPQRR